MITITPQLSQLKSEFETARRWRRAHREPLQLNDIRWEAFDRFLSLGFPTTNDPDWRFTDVAPIAEKFFALAAEADSHGKHSDIARLNLSGDLSAELIFINGYYAASASIFPDLPADIKVQALSQVLDSQPADVEPYLARIAPHLRQPFGALNTALFTDGACILIPAHSELKSPIHLRFISTGEADRQPAMSHPRILIVLGEGSHAAIVENFAGPNGIQYFTNAVTEVVLAEHANLQHYKLQCESTEAYHIGATYIAAARGANCSAHSVSLGGGLVRNDLVASLGGEHVECEVNGLYVAGGERLIDHHTRVHHGMGHSKSRQLYRGIVADNATSVSDSKVIIAPEAQNAETDRRTRILLLSDRARIRSSSEVENAADQFSSTETMVSRHIEEEMKPYLGSQSRREAIRSAVQTCVSDMLGQLTFEPLAASVKQLLDQQLESIVSRLE